MTSALRKTAIHVEGRLIEGGRAAVRPLKLLAIGGRPHRRIGDRYQDLEELGGTDV
jgi:hypothetical protein